MKSASNAGILQALGGIPAYAGKRPSCRLAQLMAWDHPRVCGEKLQEFICRLIQQGSPPRMRGKEQTVAPAVCRTGITPAYAGKSPLPRAEPSGVRDHPRVCGEKPTPPVGWGALSGSPPRMRGKVHFAFPLYISKGITPAYAGKSFSQTFPYSHIQDHPRVCGEKRAPFTTSPSSGGTVDHPRVCGEKKCTSKELYPL